MEKDMNHDAEKAVPRTSTSDASSSSSSGSDSIRLEPIQTNKTNHSLRSVATHRLDGTDPYQNLENALTPDPDFAAECIAHTRTAASTASNASRPPDFEVVFEDGDPENPKNWSTLYRAWIIAALAYTGWIVVLYSTSYASTIPGLVEEFDSSTTVATLGMTTYLLGLAAGSLFLAPVSELYGRQKVYLVCLICWALLILPSGLATNLTSIIVSRFFCAFFGAVMIANSPGTVVDIANPEFLAFVLSMWSIAPMNAPSTGGIIGGFVYQYLGWRWSGWIVLIGGGVGIGLMATCKETYPPTILKRKAARMRKETGDERWWCQFDQRESNFELAKINLKRPIILFFTEPILWFLNFWLSLVYGVLYLCFVAYPIVFSQHRGWTPGISGLAFSGIGIGTMIAILTEPLIRRFINSQPRDPETGKVPPESTALVMAIGSIFTAVGQLVFAWTCLPTTIHWVIPIIFGIPFGLGNTLSFIYGANYLAGAYGIYSASALAGNAVVRSIFGGVLPLAGARMYQALTPQWAGTLLGLLEVMMIPIPFVFWKYGAKIRSKSPVICQLREEQERLDARRARYLAKLARREAQAAERNLEKNSEVEQEVTVAEDPGEEKISSA
ncbi:unnamed protein product [Clonostachys rosea]|uniref:Major facilitator superfamily (MFS) profile domain-containing protein n=1 Tax=Bionectria ochroleuca TaxID=29856 RepID=A0ABY6TQ57_BIOOC|nr:unnamed protein product [Clonostachys rosea]